MLQAVRNASLFLQNEREISDAERFYALYREQFTRDLTVPESVVEK